MAGPQGECPFCSAAIPKTKAIECPRCKVGFPIGSFATSEKREVDDSIRLAFSRTLDPETSDDIIAVFNAVQLEGRQGVKTDKVAKKGDKRYVDAEDQKAIAQEKARVKWDEIASKAEVRVKRQPWSLHEGGGYCWLKRWVNRTAELRWLNPLEPPRVLPVFGSIATLEGKPFIVPIRRKAELQKILEEHNSGLRLADLVRSHSRRGRRHRKEGRKEIPEWERDRNEILLLQMRLRVHYPQGDVPQDDQEAIRYVTLRHKWKDSKRCLRNNCLNFIPKKARQHYCSDACKQRAKKARRSR